ncbi:hypothetical protein TBLA_0E02680 [Henningerozyma blattae CBS 6284]|uniref:DUF2470 domain-containing protein n=1 Tax=Henningerozyma blattae (strain ATCC 34711 / CBS 6284 / DSM 70876 / NBRC 10599 / NRRL Y-10934 / UCD 77-7) TaxID=1071380 RepID=I2H4M2_HENB6|nr:hypothetical protein TBLA_0E02680 [Tetrapisispora blattae CBS 6284]CCH61324.1 hypothetical protein TBLA_0E02680 [Tetrapisispora blattae CBS 6284]
MGTSAKELTNFINKYHKLAIIDILHVFTDITESTNINTRDVTLLDINSSYVTLKWKQNMYKVESAYLKEASSKQEVFFQIAEDAAKNRNVAPVRITKVLWPIDPLGLLVIFGVLLPPIVYVYRPFLYWIPIIPSVITPYLDNDIVLIIIMILEFLIHICETFFILLPKLKYYRVPYKHYKCWYFLGFLEGFGPCLRIEKEAALKLSKYKKY